MRAPLIGEQTMIPDVTIPVERFHRVLVDEIQKQRPTYLDTSFTVAEIYQILVPYRSHRDALGVEMNGDYEDALLRLLAGAGELVVLESDDARSRILKELQSKNPNTGLFREFAGAGVHLNPEGLPTALRGESDDRESTAGTDSTQGKEDERVPGEGFVAGEITPAAATAEAAPAETGGMEATYFDFETSSLEDLVEEPRGATMSDATAPAPQKPPESGSVVTGAASRDDAAEATPISLVSATEKPTEPGGGFWKPGEHPVNTSTSTVSESNSASAPIHASAGSCQWCDAKLPDRAQVNFCQECGVNTSLRPCGGCRAEMEASWKFCISCGSQSQAS